MISVVMNWDLNLGSLGERQATNPLSFQRCLRVLYLYCSLYPALSPPPKLGDNVATYLDYDSRTEEVNLEATLFILTNFVKNYCCHTTYSMQSVM